MKGIITKDLLSLRQIAVTMGLLMVFYLFLGFIRMKDAGGGLSYFSIMALVINVMIPLSCAGYDEQCDWDSYGAALPVSKNKIVVCRYLVSLLVMGFTTLVVLTANLIFAAFGGTPTGILGYLFPILISSVYIAIMTPIIYKFGVQKSRIIIIAIMLVPAMLIGGLGILLSNALEEESSFMDGKIDTLASLPMVPITVCATLFVAAFYFLSMLLSMKIYAKKEL